MSEMSLAPRRPQRADYTNPGRPAWIGFGVVVAFLSFFMLWGTLAPVSGAAIANGALQVQGKRQTVQHPYGGVVKELAVREGEHVNKGQVLITLFDSDARAKLDVLSSERDAALAQEARLTTERDGGDTIAFADTLTRRTSDPNVRQAMANEQALLGVRRRQFDTETDVQRKKVAQLTEQIEGYRAQVNGLNAQTALLQKETEGAEKLLQSGFTPQTRVWALHRDLAKLEADRGARNADIAGSQQQIAQTDLEIAKIERARLSDITDQLRTVQSKLVELQPKIEAAQDVVNRTAIRAPATGAVVGLEVFTEGGVIQPGTKLMDIVPSDDPLMAEARLPLNGVNEVARGQRAEVRLTSINYVERPSLYGTITNISADRLTDDKTGQGYYSVQVALDQNDIKRSHVDLTAGMPVEVIVPTKPRTLLQYLVGPLRDEIAGAFRER